MKAFGEVFVDWIFGYCSKILVGHKLEIERAGIKITAMAWAERVTVGLWLLAVLILVRAEHISGAKCCQSDMAAQNDMCRLLD